MKFKQFTSGLFRGNGKEPTNYRDPPPPPKKKIKQNKTKQKTKKVNQRTGQVGRTQSPALSPYRAK